MTAKGGAGCQKKKKTGTGKKQLLSVEEEAVKIFQKTLREKKTQTQTVWTGTHA